MSHTGVIVLFINVRMHDRNVTAALYAYNTEWKEIFCIANTTDFKITPPMSEFCSLKRKQLALHRSTQVAGSEIHIFYEVLCYSTQWRVEPSEYTRKFCHLAQKKKVWHYPVLKSAAWTIPLHVFMHVCNAMAHLIYKKQQKDSVLLCHCVFLNFMCTHHLYGMALKWSDIFVVFALFSSENWCF